MSFVSRSKTLPLTADSDEVAQAFRDDVARYSDMMSPRAGCLAGEEFLASGCGTVNASCESQQAASERALHSAVAMRAACGRYADERRARGGLLRTRLLLGRFVRLGASQAVPGEIDPVRVVDEAIENGISVSGITD
jgi:hypothetical protein